MHSVDIADDDWLYRRVMGYCIVGGKVSSSAFKNRRKKPETEISVDLAKLVSPEESLRRAGMEHLSVVALQARDPRALGLEVIPDPLPDNDAHALIVGENDMTKCQQLAEKALVKYQP